jgi:hypothetical protein
MKIPKLKKKAFKIDLVIYPYTIFIGFLDPHSLMKTLEQHKYPIKEEELEKVRSILERETSDYAAITHPLSNGNIVIFVPEQTNPNYIVNMITHETLHATEMIMSRIGMTLCEQSDEAFCYLNGYINQEIFKQI